MRSGRFWIDNALYDEGWMKKISGNDFMVFIAISRHFNKFGRCYPSIRTLEKNISMGHEAISKSVYKLEAVGLIKIEKVKRGHKLLFIFTKCALDLMPKYEKVSDKPEPKETIKEKFKEDLEYVEEIRNGMRCMVPRRKQKPSGQSMQSIQDILLQH